MPPSNPVVEDVATEATQTQEKDCTKFTSKKSKLTAKSNVKVSVNVNTFN